MQGLLTYRRKYQEVSQTFFFCPDPPFCGTYRAGARGRDCQPEKGVTRARTPNQPETTKKNLYGFFLTAETRDILGNGQYKTT